jgi:hypothetical protein
MQLSESQVLINHRLWANWSIHWKDKSEIQTLVANTVLEHKQDLGKYILAVAILVMSTNKCAVTALVSMEVWIAMEIVHSKLPVNDGLVVHLEVAIFL